MILLGLIALRDDGDIFVGFLWVIDLGVGLIVFIFIMHFSNFLHQKSALVLNERYFFFSFFSIFFFFIFFFFISFPNYVGIAPFLKKTWFFFISWYDYYSIFFLRQITELQLLRQIYFLWSGFNFFLINFSLLYGLISVIMLAFLIKKIFVVLSLPEFDRYSIMSNINSFFFIRNQNFMKQQNTTAGTKIWVKKKYLNYDF